VRFIVAATLVACLTTPLVVSSVHTQTAQAQPPRFRAGVDLLTLQTSVVDKSGVPVADLQPSDFTVRVDGQPRTVLFARFYRATDMMTGAATPAVAAPASNTATSGGRVVVFVVDRDSIRSGSERPFLDSAAKLLDALTPADAVGLVGIPTGTVELTRDHTRVREQLLKMTGTEPRLMVGDERTITWNEAYAIADQRDANVRAMVIERECGNKTGPANCAQMIDDQAREILQVGRGHVRSALAVLTNLAKRLEPIRAPKHIVLLSGGKGFDQDLLPDYRQFARQTAASGIVVYAVHLDQIGDAASTRRGAGSSFGGRDMSTGLTTIAGMTGGAYYSATARAVGVFDRIKSEVNNFYELGIESTAADEGKPHEIEVKVNRPGVSVRARQQVMLPVAGATTSAPADPLLTLLQQPVDAAEIPLNVAAYTTRGSEPSTLKVMLSAELGGPQTRAPAEWAFLFLAPDGQLAADGRQTIEQPAEGPWALTASAQLAPGRYRLRFAVIDAGRRAGLIDVPLVIGLRAAGGLQMSDLIVGTPVESRLQPRSRLAQGSRLTALIEIMSADAALLEKSRVAFELVPAGSAEPVQRVLMAARSAGSDVVLLNEAHVETSSLAPGRYTASAIPLVDGQPVGRVSRVVEITRR
jgi:VWFA-related protein